MKEYLATSLDGWLVVKYEMSDDEKESDDSESEDEGQVMDPHNYIAD